MRSLGASAEEIVDHLAEAMVHQYPEVQERLGVIRKVTEHADDHEALLEMAMAEGYNPGSNATGAPGMPTLRFDSRSRGSAAVADRSRQPAGTPQQAQKNTRPNIDNEIEYLEKRRKLAELERDAASLERDAARASHERANIEAKGKSAKAEPAADASAAPLPPAAGKVSLALGLGPAGKETAHGSQPASDEEDLAAKSERSAASGHSNSEIAAFKKRLQQLEAEACAQSHAESSAKPSTVLGILSPSSGAPDEGASAAPGADLRRALSSRAAELAAPLGAKDGKVAQAKEGTAEEMATKGELSLKEELAECQAQAHADRSRLQEFANSEKAVMQELAEWKARATELTEWQVQAVAAQSQLQEAVARAEATVQANCAAEHQAKQDHRELREELAEKLVQFDADRSRLQAELTEKQVQFDADRSRLQAELTEEMTEMEAFHKQRLELLAEQKDITAQELIGVTCCN